VAESDGVMRKITRVVQSPLNPLQWCVELDCGHERWVTRVRAPRRKGFRCMQCQRKEEKSRGK
jgi:hypothetical protein